MSLIHKSLEQMRRREALSSVPSNPNQSVGSITLDREHPWSRRFLIILLACLLLVLGGIITVQFVQDLGGDSRPDSPVMNTEHRSIEPRALGTDPAQETATADESPASQEPAASAPPVADAGSDGVAESSSPTPSEQPSDPVPAQDLLAQAQTITDTAQQENEPAQDQTIAETPSTTDRIETDRDDPDQAGAFPHFDPEPATEDTGQAPAMEDNALQDHFRNAANTNNRVMDQEQALVSALAAGDLATASLELEGLLALIGRNGSAALKWQGYFALREHNWVAAEQFYRRALAQIPSDVESRYNLCISLVRLERFAEARAIVGRLAEERPLDDRVRQLETLVRSHTGS